MQWGVKAYKEWRTSRINDIVNFDIKIFDADLDKVDVLTKENFAYALCSFIPEVTKLDGSDYPGKTLYEMLMLIQKFLHQSRKYWKLLDDSEFRDVKTVLDNVMKERAINNIGMVKKQAGFIPLDFEDTLWHKGVLGEDTPDKLRDTVLFLLGINLGLRAGDEHYDLRRECKTKPSQLSFERAPNGKRCLVYREDTVTKANDGGGLKSMNREGKVIWVYPAEDVVKCPIRLVDKYMSLLPMVGPKTKKTNFYLRSLEKPNPAQWYGEMPVGRHTLTKVVSELLKNVELDGFFSNHSLRRTSTTHLFQAGIDKKIIKEFTGHSSDAVDKYQVTSDMVKESLSKILRGENKENTTRKSDASLEVTVKQNSQSNGNPTMCTCKSQKVNVNETDQIGSMINGIVNARRPGKATIKIEIVFSD